MNNILNFYLPGFSQTVFDFNLAFIKYFNDKRDYFRDNVAIGAVYGAFPSATWNGGRVDFGNSSSFDAIEGSLHAFNDLGIPVRYTYTNSCLTEKDLGDAYCNATMKLGENGLNEVLVNSPILEEYLRKTYPNYKYALSTTTCCRDIDKINEATKKYDMVVIDYRDNRNFDFLEKIEDKDKIEILVDEVCDKDCAFRKKHYENISKAILRQVSTNAAGCMNKKSSERAPELNFYTNMKLNNCTTLTREDVFGKYADMGFKNFKLIGRGVTPFFAFESYVYFLVKPEYIDTVRYDLYSLLLPAQPIRA